MCICRYIIDTRTCKPTNTKGALPHVALGHEPSALWISHTNPAIFTAWAKRDVHSSPQRFLLETPMLGNKKHAIQYDQPYEWGKTGHLFWIAIAAWWPCNHKDKVVVGILVLFYLQLVLSMLSIFLEASPYGWNPLWAKKVPCFFLFKSPRLCGYICVFVC